jgi:hypothetical protein
MFRKYSKFSFYLILAALLALSVFIVNCNCGVDDDDADDDADDDGDDDIYQWPDNTGPVVGWVAVYHEIDDNVEREWDALYEIREDDYVEVAPPCDSPFNNGSLATRDVGWVLNDKIGVNELYQLDEGEWTLMDPQPPCPQPDDEDTRSLKEVKVFPDGKGLVLCTEAYLLSWDLENWTAHELPSDETDISIQGGLDCLEWDDCVVWTYKHLFWWDGSGFSTEVAMNTFQILKQNLTLDYRFYWVVNDIDNYRTIEVHRDGAWTNEEIPFLGDNFAYTIMYRINERHTAFAYTKDAFFCNTILNDDLIEVQQSWPKLSKMDFAQSGGGLGLGFGDQTVYRIFGTEVEAIFNHGFSGSNVLILAADAQ